MKPQSLECLPLAILAALLTCPALADDAGPILESLQRLTLPAIDLHAVRAEDVEREAAGLPMRFAIVHSVSVRPPARSGWARQGTAELTWSLVVRSPGAHSLNFGFRRFRMPPGGRLAIAAANGSHRLRPFTAMDEDAHGELWTPVVSGEEAVIQVAVPADRLEAVELELAAVGHGYRSFGAPRPEKSGSCNVDVICSEGDPWRDQIRSVAAIVIGGAFLCSGFLVNNTSGDRTPYFLTAGHCGLDAGNAATLVVYWNYENSTCRTPGSPSSGGPGDGSQAQFNTGSTFRAGASFSDFTLVELDDPIDPAFHVFYAGWDATAADSSSAVAIHHPNGEEKRISFEDQPTTTTSYLSSTVPGDGSHLRVADWDLGTTEGGSSGSPLFNPAKRVIGQLHGGFAACGNNSSDWYGRFAVSFSNGGTASTQLSDWLDAAGTGLLAIDGLDSSVSLFADGFESGDTSAWSATVP